MGKRLRTKGKVVLVPFPFYDLSSSKVRPAVCLTDPIGPHHHVVIAFISSQMPNDATGTDVVLDPPRGGFVATGFVANRRQRLPLLLRHEGGEGWGEEALCSNPV
jgi:mRNA interferase MazF